VTDGEFAIVLLAAACAYAVWSLIWFVVIEELIPRLARRRDERTGNEPKRDDHR